MNIEKSVIKIGKWELFQNADGKINIVSTTDNFLIEANYWLKPYDGDPSNLTTFYPEAKDTSIVYSKTDSSFYLFDKINDKWDKILAGGSSTSVYWKDPVQSVADLVSTYTTPLKGFISLVTDNNRLYVYDGLVWKVLSGGSSSSSTLTYNNDIKVEAQEDLVNIYKDLHMLDNSVMFGDILNYTKIYHDSSGLKVSTTNDTMFVTEEKNKEISFSFKDVNDEGKTSLVLKNDESIFNSDETEIAKINKNGLTLDKNIRIKDNDISVIKDINDNSELTINNNSYNDTQDKYRDLNIKDGKGNSVLKISGQNKEVHISGELTTTKKVILGLEPENDMDATNKRYVDACVEAGSVYKSVNDKKSIVPGYGSNSANCDYSTVNSGFNNTSSGDFSSILNGCNNVNYGKSSSIINGQTNSITGSDNIIGTGTNNNICGKCNSIISGQSNIILSVCNSSILNGKGNKICENSGTILNGINNEILPTHNNVLISGNNLKSSNEKQLILGEWNDFSKNNLTFIIGNGTDNSNRKNALEIDKTGNVNIKEGAKYLVNGEPLSSGGLLKKTENGITGYRRNDAIDDNFLQIGQNAVDLSTGSISETPIPEETKTGASGINSFVSGLCNTASGTNSTAIGSCNKANGQSSFAYGDQNIVDGMLSKVGGICSVVSGVLSQAFGENLISNGYRQTVIGRFNLNNSQNVFEIGNGINNENRKNLFSIEDNGDVNIIGNIRKNGEVLKQPALIKAYRGEEGYILQNEDTNKYNRIGINAIDLGFNCEVGQTPIISGAGGDYSFSTGYASGALGKVSNASGNKTCACGDYSNASGNETCANGENSNANGKCTSANGVNSFTANESTIAGFENQSAFGKFNRNYEDSIFEIGDGYSDTHRSNALRLDRHGNLHLGGVLKSGQNDFREGAFCSILTDDFKHSWRRSDSCTFSNSVVPGLHAFDMNYNESAGHIGGFGAIGDYSFSIGRDNLSKCENSYSFGFRSCSMGENSYTFGTNVSSNKDNQIVFGRYNNLNSSAYFMIGNGQDGNNKNIFEISDTGDINIPLGSSYKINNIPLTNGQLIKRKNETTGKYGYSLIDNVPVYFEETGDHATNLSYNDNVSTKGGSSGDYSFSIGLYNNACGRASFVQGSNNISSGHTSSTFGYSNTTKGQYSTTFGNHNSNLGNSSIISGSNISSSGYNVALFGSNLISTGISQLIGGYFNEDNVDNILTIGNGTSDGTRSNALEIKKNGDAYLKGYFYTDKGMKMGEDKVDLNNIPLLNSNSYNMNYFDYTTPNRPVKIDTGYVLNMNYKFGDKYTQIAIGADTNSIGMRTSQQSSWTYFYNELNSNKDDVDWKAKTLSEEGISLVNKYAPIDIISDNFEDDLSTKASSSRLTNILNTRTEKPKIIRQFIRRENEQLIDNYGKNALLLLPVSVFNGNTSSVELGNVYGETPDYFNIEFKLSGELGDLGNIFSQGDETSTITLTSTNIIFKIGVDPDTSSTFSHPKEEGKYEFSFIDRHVLIKKNGIEITNDTLSTDLRFSDNGRWILGQGYDNYAKFSIADIIFKNKVGETLISLPLPHLKIGFKPNLIDSSKWDTINFVNVDVANDYNILGSSYLLDHGTINRTYPELNNWNFDNNYVNGINEDFLKENTQDTLHGVYTKIQHEDGFAQRIVVPDLDEVNFLYSKVSTDVKQGDTIEISYDVNVISGEQHAFRFYGHNDSTPMLILDVNIPVTNGWVHVTKILGTASEGDILGEIELLQHRHKPSEFYIDNLVLRKVPEAFPNKPDNSSAYALNDGDEFIEGSEFLNKSDFQIDFRGSETDTEELKKPEYAYFNKDNDDVWE